MLLQVAQGTSTRVAATTALLGCCSMEAGDRPGGVVRILVARIYELPNP